MAPRTFADRPINKLVLFDVDGTLTPARQVDVPSGCRFLVSDVPFICGGIERISCDHRAPVRVEKESHYRFCGRFGSRKDLGAIGRRWQSRSALIITAQWRCLLTLLPLAVVDKFDYGFAENGLTAYKLGKQLPSQSFIKHVGEDKYKPLVNFILHYIADLDIPIKR